MGENFISSGSSERQAIAVTGTAIQLPGGACKAVVISAKIAITNLSGGASTNNADVILLGVGAAPTFATAYAGISLSPGESITLQVYDSSMIWINGTAGDAVTFTRLF